MSAILDWFTQIGEDRDAAGNPNDTSPRANTVRAACDWSASKGGLVSGAPWVQATCRPYWNDNPDYDVPEEPEVPFTGGQCAGVLYTVTGSVTGDRGNGQEIISSWNASGRPGPIALVTFELDSGTGGVDIDLRDGNNAVIRQLTGTFSSFGDLQFSNTNVREDGQPDDCGDPEGVPIPPVDVPGLPPDGTPIDVSPPGWTGPPITITFSPDEDPYAPIDTPFGPGDVFAPPGQPPQSGPGSEPLPPSEGDDVAGGDPSGEEETPGLEAVIGYSWEFPNIPSDRGGVAGKVPRTFFEALGTIQLKLQDPDGGRYYDRQYVIRESRGSVFRKDETVSVVGVSWAVKPSFGVVQIRPLVAEEQ